MNKMKNPYAAYAEHEFQIAGTPEELQHPVLNLLELFYQEGHSGMSAGLAVTWFVLPASERPAPSAEASLDKFTLSVYAAMLAHLRTLDAELDLTPEPLRSDVQNLFCKLALFKPISPLTGEEDEWLDWDNNVRQNKRCGHVFQERNGDAYDSMGLIWREESGVCFTDTYSRLYIQFPYAPTAQVLSVDEHPMKGV